MVTRKDGGGREKKKGGGGKRVKLRRIIRLAYEMKFLRVAVGLEHRERGWGG